jgi:hypothetical protein
LQGIFAHVVDGRGIDPFRNLTGEERAPAGHLIDAASAGAIQPEVARLVNGAVPVFPADLQGPSVLCGTYVLRGCRITAHLWTSVAQSPVMLSTSILVQ